MTDTTDDANIWSSYGTRARTLLGIGAMASFALFWTVAGMFSFPRFYGYSASIMQQPGAILILLMASVVFLVSVGVTSIFTHVVHFEGGLFCASLGLLALSVRGGPMRYVLMDSPGAGIFIKLLIELVLLFIPVFAGWMLISFMRDGGLIRGEPHGEADPDDLPGQGLMALGAQVALMIFFMLVLAQTDRKAQVVWSVALSAYLAALAAHSLFPSRPSYWYWMTPLIVGVIGYVLAYMGGNNLAAGDVGGLVPALGRPLPLDYASAGVAGSLYGYWTSRRWQYEREYEPADPDAVENRLEHPPQNA